MSWLLKKTAGVRGSPGSAWGDQLLKFLLHLSLDPHEKQRVEVETN